MDTFLVERLWDKVKYSSTCWEWLAGRDSHGYGVFKVTSAHGKASVGAHRAMWAHVFGYLPTNKMVLHKCDNRGCVRPTHLFLGTAQDNSLDMLAKGRGNTSRGEVHYRTKLTWAEVREMRRLKLVGRSTSELAKRYGLTVRGVLRITSGQNWREDPPAPVDEDGEERQRDDEDYDPTDWFGTGSE